MKVAVVGCGGMGRHHALNFRALPEAELVGVCDINAELASRVAEAAGTTAYTSFDELLGDAGPEVVSIALPSFLHKEYAIKAAEAGKHVICEKPIALTLRDAQEMLQSAERNGVRLFVCQVVRFYPGYADMKRAVTSGAIGRIGTAHAKRIGEHPGAGGKWFGEPDKSGGVIVDLMIHDIDFMRWTLGEVRSVYGLNRQSDGMDYALATLIFESGAVANLEAHWGYPGPFRTAAEIAGSEGLIRSDSHNQQSLHIHKPLPSAAGYSAMPQSPTFSSPNARQLAHFLACIRGESEPIVTAHDACKALEIALAALESARTGQAVQMRGDKQ